MATAFGVGSKLYKSLLLASSYSSVRIVYMMCGKLIIYDECKKIKTDVAKMAKYSLIQ